MSTQEVLQHDEIARTTPDTSQANIAELSRQVGQKIERGQAEDPRAVSDAARSMCSPADIQSVREAFEGQSMQAPVQQADKGANPLDSEWVQQTSPDRQFA